MFKVFYQQGDYAKPLEQEITADIRDKSEYFCKRADTCLHLRTKKIDSGVDRIENRFDLIEKMFVGLVKDAECNVPVSLHDVNPLTSTRAMCA